MRLLERRRLTDGEILLGRGIFADEIEWRSVRIAQLPPLGFAAMVPLGETIWFSNWRAPNDFARTLPAAQSWFIHELAHVWQARRGVVLAFAKLRALTRGAYRVNYRPGRPFEAYNIEAQAEIARLLFLARAGFETKPKQADLEDVWARRKPAEPQLEEAEA